MSDLWRLAFMFDARGGDLDALEGALARAAEPVRRRAGGPARLGLADRHPDLATASKTDYATDQWRSVDGAVEITLRAPGAQDLEALSRGLAEIIRPMAEPGTVEVMAGPMFSMVPPRDGEAFLSLAFRRDPATTSAQFRRWWHDQHAEIAIPVLGPGLLAYDQVHVDAELAAAAARGFGVAAAAYDAYDNLTWADRDGYIASISDLDGMARIFRDEIGRIDDRTRRHALMRRVA